MVDKGRLRLLAIVLADKPTLVKASIHVRLYYTEVLLCFLFY